MNHAKRVLFGTILLLAIFLDACAPASPTNPTDTLDAIYTSAAQTVEAEAASSVQPTLIPVNTDSSLTLTASGISSATSPPTLVSAFPTSTSAAATSSGCDGASYISDVTIPDHTVENAGQTFVKTWMFQNTGSCAWDSNYALTFVSGDQMGGTNTNIGSSVAAGQQAALSVTLTAPTTSGEYTGYWRLANDSGQAFGVTVYVIIDVNEDATATYADTETPAATETNTPITNTPTPSSTPTPSNTPGPTKTPTSTRTPVPSKTPTSTRTPVPSKTPTPT